MTKYYRDTTKYSSQEPLATVTTPSPLSKVRSVTVKSTNRRPPSRSQVAHKSKLMCSRRAPQPCSHIRAPRAQGMHSGCNSGLQRGSWEGRAQKTGGTRVRVTIQTNSWHQTIKIGTGIQDVVAEPSRWAEHRGRKCRAERAQKSGSRHEVDPRVQETCFTGFPALML